LACSPVRFDEHATPHIALSSFLVDVYEEILKLGWVLFGQLPHELAMLLEIIALSESFNKYRFFAIGGSVLELICCKQLDFSWLEGLYVKPSLFAIIVSRIVSWFNAV